MRTSAQEIVSKKQLRSFGLIVGAIFALIGVWPILWRHEPPRWWSIGLGSYLGLSGLLLPNSLALIHKGWMRVGHVMGWINTRIILGVAFFALVTPIGAIRSYLLGKDPMGRNLRPGDKSYRVVSKSRSASHLTKQY